MNEFGSEGLVFDVRDRGPADGAPVVLLHGFPQDATSWDELAGRLADAGYRTLAPDQRGYSPRARPRGRAAYAMPHLTGDVLALLDAAGLDSAHVIGHDWGGAVAWALGARHPDRVRTITALSTPHPSALGRAVLRGGQALRSWYMGLFQLPWLPERMQLARGGAPLRLWLERSGLPASYAAHYAARMAEPRALPSALMWYRAFPLVLRAPIGRVGVPTLYVWGDRDPALGRAAAERTREFVDGPYRFEVLPGAGHWLLETAAWQVGDFVLAHLAGAERSG
ncbi:MAG TPA: alpha/beta fold hydrolase [Mycobacteriales bacterium]|nr:alpha/beta fold hydrolase [Mycobacteriales bacterium]